MVDLLAAEGDVIGSPLTTDERELLAGQGQLPDELQQKARSLVGRMLDQDRCGARDEDPRTFNNSMEWAADSAWPNIVEITAQIATERKPDHRLHGWPLVKDKIFLIGCGVLAVLLMLTTVVAMGFVFHWK